MYHNQGWGSPYTHTLSLHTMFFAFRAINLIGGGDEMTIGKMYVQSTFIIHHTTERGLLLEFSPPLQTNRDIPQV